MKKILLRAKRFIWLCFILFLLIGCGVDKKQTPQEILSKWSNVRERMTNQEVINLLGKPNNTFFENGETVYFYSSGLTETELYKKGLQPSELIVYVTNGVVKVRHISYQ